MNNRIHFKNTKIIWKSKTTILESLNIDSSSMISTILWFVLNKKEKKNTMTYGITMTSILYVWINNDIWINNICLMIIKNIILYANITRHQELMTLKNLLFIFTDVHTWTSLDDVRYINIFISFHSSIWDWYSHYAKSIMSITNLTRLNLSNKSKYANILKIYVYSIMIK